MKSIAGLLLLAALGYAGICAYFFIAQRSMLYYPTAEANSREATALFVDTGEATIKVWRVGANSRNALLYFGGNAEDVAQSINEFQAALPNFTLYFVNYRGYGGSGGSPSEHGFFHDALHLFDEIASRHGAVSVLGRSLGSAVATMLASERDVDRLILITPFDSIASIAQAHYRWLPVSLLVRDKFDSAARAAAVTCPTLILIASADEVIPRQHTDNLVDALAHAPLTVIEISGTTHNSIGSAPRFLDSIAQFLQ